MSILLCCIFYKVKPQSSLNSLSGVVKDRSNFKILDNAIITLTNTETNYKQKTITDNNGHFLIRKAPEGKLTLNIKMLGYEPYNDTVSIDKNDKFITVLLNPVSVLLKDIQIVSNKERSFIEFSKGKITLNVQNSPIATGGNAYDALLRIPGLMEQNAGLSFRAKSVNVLIDGRATNLHGEDLKNYLSVIPSNTVAKIEVILNPSTKYDGQGGSVINIVLVKNDSFGMNGSVQTNAGYGQKFRHGEGLILNYGTEKINLYGAYNFTNNQQYYKEESASWLSDRFTIKQEELERRKRNIHTFRLGADYNISPNAIVGVQFRGLENFGRRSVVNQSTESLSLNPQTTSTLSGVHISNPYFNGYLNYSIDSLGKKLSLNVDFFGQNKQWNDTVRLTSLQHPNNIDFYIGNQPVNIALRSVSVDYTNPLPVGKFEAGLKAQSAISKNNPQWEQIINGQAMTDFNRTYQFQFLENLYAAYLNWVTSWKKFNLTIGLRNENLSFKGKLNATNRTHFNYLLPSVAIEYELTDNSAFNLNYRKNINRFSFTAVNPFRTFINPYLISVGNPSLKPAIDHDMEFNYTYKQSLVFGISYTRTLQVISSVNKQEDKTLIMTIDNLPYSEFFYFYTNLPYEFFSWWSINFSGGYGFYHFKTREQSITNNNRSWSYLTQLASYFTIGKTWRAELNGFARGPYATGIYKSKGLYTMGIGVKKMFAKNKINVSFSIADIFNSNVNKQTSEYTDIVVQSENKTESRFFMLGLTYKFGSNKKRNFDTKDARIETLEKRL